MSTAVTNAIQIDRNHPRKVSPVVYGWHYEEIGLIGDGGLYAEMIRNRNFTQGGPAPGMAIENGRYRDIPRNDLPGRRPEPPCDLEGWSAVGKGISLRRIQTDAQPRRFAMRMTCSATDSSLQGAANAGFLGIRIEQGRKYRLTLHLSAAQPGMGVRAAVFHHDTPLTSCATIRTVPAERTCFELTLTGEQTCDDGLFLLSPLQAGCITLHFASLLPLDTWNGGRTFFRRDIMQNLADFRPEFLRFPGGCIVHGVNTETMYHWKDTIVDPADRPASWSKWDPHWISNGIGYHEFYELCEALGADAMYVAPSGLICTDWAFQKGNSTDYTHPDVDVNEYIQDCLDAIEYAIGPVNSFWGSKRAAKGHPAAFPLKYLSIGNEDFGPRYYAHYDTFYRAVKQRYPQLIIVANSIVGNRSNSDWSDKRCHLAEFPDPSAVEYFDEHYYDTGDWVFENFDLFDTYSRSGPGLMCLELGLNAGQPDDILYESVFLMMMEKNGDLNPIFAARPLMRRWEYVEGKLNPLYYHTSGKSWKTAHYHAKKLFRDNRFDILFPSSCFRADGQTIFDEETLFTTAGLDSSSGEMIVKVVNLSSHPTSACIDAGITQASARFSVLVSPAQHPSTPEESFCGGPDFWSGPCDFSAPLSFPAHSLTVIRIRL